MEAKNTCDPAWTLMIRQPSKHWSCRCWQQSLRTCLFASLVGTLSLFCNSALQAQDFSFIGGVDKNFAMIDRSIPVYVDVIDGVTGGCWLTAAEARLKVKRELIDAGFVNFVDGPSILSLDIQISVIGYDLSGASYTCTASPMLLAFVGNYSQYYTGEHQWSFFNKHAIFFDQSILSGPRSSMSSRINESIGSHIDSFIVALHEQKQELAEQVYQSDAATIDKSEILKAAQPLRP